MQDGNINIRLGLDYDKLTKGIGAARSLVRNGLSSIKMDNFKIQLNLDTAKLGDAASKSEILSVKLKSLNNQLNVQKQITAEASIAYRNVALEMEHVGTESDELKAKTALLEGKMLQARTDQLLLQKEIRQTNEMLEQQSRIQKASNMLKAEIAKVKMNLDLTNMDGAAEKTQVLATKLKGLQNQLSLQKKIVEESNQAYQASAEAKGIDAEESQALYLQLLKVKESESQLQKEIRQTTNEMREFEAATRFLGNNIGARIRNDFVDSLRAVRAELGNIFVAARMLGSQMSLMGGGIALGLGVATKSSADFGYQIGKAGAIAGATGGELEQLKKVAQQLGADPKYRAGPAQIAEGITELVKAGYDVNQALAAMPGVLNAATASGEDLALVSETMASTLNAFQLKAGQASHVADVLAKAANMSAVDINDMSYSMKYVAPVAAQLGISLEEVSAMMVELGNSGIKGERAGTTLRQSLERLVNPPKEAAKELASLGVKITDQSGSMRSFGDILEDLRVSLTGYTDAQRAKAISEIFGTESMSGMMILLSQGKDKFDQYTAALSESNGVAEQVANRMRDNLAGSLNALNKSVKAAGLAIGDALTPLIRAVADTLTSVLNTFNGLPGPIKVVGSYMLAFAGAAMLLGSGFLLLLAGLPSLVAGFKILPEILALTVTRIKGLMIATKAATAIEALSLSIKGLTIAMAENPLTLVAVAVAALGTYALYSTGAWDKLTQKITGGAKQQSDAAKKNAEEQKKAMEEVTKKQRDELRKQQLQQVSEEKVNAEKEINERVEDLRATDLQKEILAIQRKAEEYKQAGADEVKIAQWVQAEKEEIYKRDMEKRKKINEELVKQVQDIGLEGIQKEIREIDRRAEEYRKDGADQVALARWVQAEKQAIARKQFEDIQKTNVDLHEKTLKLQIKELGQKLLDLAKEEEELRKKGASEIQLARYVAEQKKKIAEDAIMGEYAKEIRAVQDSITAGGGKAEMEEAWEKAHAEAEKEKASQKEAMEFAQKKTLLFAGSLEETKKVFETISGKNGLSIIDKDVTAEIKGSLDSTFEKWRTNYSKAFAPLKESMLDLSGVGNTAAKSYFAPWKQELAKLKKSVSGIKVSNQFDGTSIKNAMAAASSVINNYRYNTTNNLQVNLSGMKIEKEVDINRVADKVSDIILKKIKQKAGGRLAF